MPLSSGAYGDLPPSWGRGLGLSVMQHWRHQGHSRNVSFPLEENEKFRIAFLLIAQPGWGCLIGLRNTEILATN